MASDRRRASIAKKGKGVAVDTDSKSDYLGSSDLSRDEVLE